MAYVTERSGKSEIWLRSAEGNWDRPVVRQSDFPKEPEIPFPAVALSPDGTRLAYTRYGKLWISRTAGGSPSAAAPALTTTVSWSPDSQSVAYAVPNILVQRIGSDQPPVPVSGPENCSSPAVWSPDGQWIACGNAPDTILLVSPDGQRRRSIPSPARPNNNNFVLVWSRDAQTLYVASSPRQSRPRLHAVDLRTGNSRLIAEYAAEPRFNMPYVRTTSGSLMRDGKSFATTVLNRRADIWMLEGFPQPRHRWF
jgi:Tol biopolymer transport system component